MIVAVTTAIVTVLGAIVTGTVKIIAAVKQGQHLIAAGQDVSMARGLVQSQHTQEIRVLVNGRVLTMLRLVATLTKKEADRTGLPDDIAAYHVALAELTSSEEAAANLAQLPRLAVTAAEIAAQDAEQRLKEAHQALGLESKTTAV